MSRDTLEGALAQVFQSISRLWWHRPGYETIGQALDVVDALGLETRANLKPVICHKHRAPYGWHLVWQLPPGISSRDLVKNIEHFEEQTGARIALKTRGSKLHMDVILIPLASDIPYKFDPAEHKNMALPVLIGHTWTEDVIADQARFPHLLSAGQTGSGKSTVFRAIAIACVQRGANLVVIDLKGGLAFQKFSNHALIADNESDALKALRALNKEHDRRIPILRDAGVEKLQDYRGGDLPYIVCIIDELAELSEKAAQLALNRLLRLSRATGICIVAATQRPSHSLFAKFTDSRMLFAAKLCFWMPKPEDSRLILDNDAAAQLPPDIAGRAIWQWAGQKEVQCPNLTLERTEELLQTIPQRRDQFELRPKRLRP